MSKTELLGVLGAEKLTNKSGNNILGHPVLLARLQHAPSTKY